MTAPDAAGLRIVAGSPTDEEVAAVTVVALAAFQSGERRAHEPLRRDDDAWRRSARSLRLPLDPGGRAWRTSLR